MTEERVVLCMRWGTLYGPDYVNLLHRAVRAHLPGPFRFVCLSNEPEGIDPEVEVYPIPDLGLLPRHWQSGAWPKLAVFAADLYGLTGRCLFIDMDTMILRDLSPFFAQEGEVITIDAGINWRKSQMVGDPESGTGIFAFTLGQSSYLHDGIMTDRDAHVARHGIEQRYVQHEAKDVQFWPAGWVCSFKYHVRRPALVGACLPPPLPPNDCKVLAFHGTPRPVDLTKRGWWGEFPNVGRGPVDWAVAYWQKYLGS